MLGLHGAISSCATQFVALYASEKLHRVTMNNFRAIQKKIWFYFRFESLCVH